MKIIYQIARILTGALFVFSGLVKLNDPSGFSIKLNEYFDVFAQDVAQIQDTVEVKCQVNGKTAFTGKYALYSFDESKTVEWHINPEKNDFPPPSVQYSVFGTWGGNQFSSDEYISESIRSAEFTAQVNGKSIYTKKETIDTGFTGIRDFKYAIDVKPFVKKESVIYDFFKGCKKYSLYFSVFFCALEVILGFAMLLGWSMNITLAITALLIVFFTFLTGYSAVYNKVTDCGCFGDFIKLKPWESFKKDLVLCVMVVLMYLGLKHYKPILSNNLNKIMGVLSFLTLLFGIYCYMHLPVWDFLPYKKGNNIKEIMNYVPPGERASDSFSIKFVMQKGADSIKVTTKEYADAVKKGFTFVRQDKQLIIAGYKSPIHDFSIYDPIKAIDYKDTMLENTGYQMLYVMPFIENTYLGNMKELNGLYGFAKENKIHFYALSSASTDPAKQFCSENKLKFDFYQSDQKMLMTMARYNPTLYLFKGPVVLEKWSGRDLPSIEKVKEFLK